MSKKLTLVAMALLVFGALGFPPAIVPVSSSAAVAAEISSAAKQSGELAWEKAVAAAKEEGAVVLYGQAGTQMRKSLGKGIKDLLGFEPEFVSAKSPEIVARYTRERTAGLNHADIIFVGQSSSLVGLKPKGVLTSPEPFLFLPEVLDTKAWPHGRLPFLDKDRMVMPLIAAYRNWIAVNKEMVKEGEIMSYLDLLNPQWKGKIVIFDPTTSGAGGTWFHHMMKLFGAEEGRKYMHRMAQQEPFFTRDSRLQVEWLAKRKYPVAVGVLPQVVQDFVKAGARIEYVRVKEGGMVLHGAGCLCFPDKPAHPNAAVAVLNWVLTEEGQRAYSQGFGEPPMRLGVTTEGINPGTVVPPDEKPSWIDEEFVLAERKFRSVAKEIFGHLMK